MMNLKIHAKSWDYDLVIYTEEELIVNLKITDKVGDHQEIAFSIKQKSNI